MKISIDRFRSTPESTLGLLYIDDKFECFTLENPSRDIKIDGETAIPTGVYEITLRREGGMYVHYKNKFGDRQDGMLWLRNVENFEWVYIHIGNYIKDTDGCPLVGKRCNPETNTVSDSTKAYLTMYSKIHDAITNGEQVFCSVVNLEG